MFSSKLTYKEIAWGYLFIIPAYLYYIPTIVTHLIYQFIFLEVIAYDGSLATILLNFTISIIIFIMLLVLLRKYIIDNLKAFFQSFWKNIRWTFTRGIFISYGLSILGALLIVLILGEDAAVDGSSNQQLFELLQNTGPMLMLIQSVILAPIVEELVFRGIIFRSLTKKNLYLAHFVSSLAFGFVHVYSYLFSGDMTQLVYMLMYALMGFAFSYAYQKRGTIFVPILLHAINNTIAFLVSYM